MPNNILQGTYGISKASLEATTTNTENVLSGKEYYVFQNGELVRKTGSMPNQGSQNYAVNSIINGSSLIARINKGCYMTTAASGYPEIYIPYADEELHSYNMYINGTFPAYREYSYSGTGFLYYLFLFMGYGYQNCSPFTVTCSGGVPVFTTTASDGTNMFGFVGIYRANSLTSALSVKRTDSQGSDSDSRVFFMGLR